MSSSCMISISYNLPHLVHAHSEGNHMEQEPETVGRRYQNKVLVDT